MATGLTNRAGGAYHYQEKPPQLKDSVYDKWGPEPQREREIYIIQLLLELRTMINNLSCKQSNKPIQPTPKAGG